MSRTVRITPAMTQDEFVQACSDAWRDRIVPGIISWSNVRNPPSFHISTKAQVILRQGDVENTWAHLIHWDAWPLLRKTRATVVLRDEILQNVLDRVRFDGNRLRGNDQYGAFYDSQGVNVHLGNDDLVHVPSSTVLYAFVQHVPSESSEGSLSDAEGSSVERSTRFPDSSEDSDDGDEVSWVTSHWPQAHFDSNGPYPWETDWDSDVEVDEMVEDEEPDPHVDFLSEDRFQMMTHAQFLCANVPHQDQTWVAVTFAIGLVSLGRRDVDFEWSEIDALPEKIAHLWSDHVVRGTAQLHFVAPQPEGLHVRPYLVFLVAVKYGNDHGQDERAVLVREMSPDHGVVSDRPCPALLQSFMSPPAIVSELGHHECFPIGLRDCHVRMGGRWLDRYSEAFIQHGNLCDVFIARFPEYVELAENSLVGAETMFQMARACVESSPVQVLFTLRLHGVSPRNRPLGSRDVHVTYDELKSLNWIEHARAIWPFVDHTALFAFVPSITADIGEVHDRPVFHFVISFVTDGDGAPVLVRQALHEVSSFRTHKELWAVVLPREADESQVRRSLNRSPFWFHPQVRTHIRFLEEDLRVHDNDWRAGDVVDLRVNVVRMEFMLAALREMDMRDQDERKLVLEDEQASMLQLFQKLHEDQVAGDGSTDISAFAEICIDCYDACLKEVTLTAKSEVNLGLRNANVTTGAHCNAQDGSRYQIHDEGCHSEKVDVGSAFFNSTKYTDQWHLNEIFQAQKIEDEFEGHSPCPIQSESRAQISFDAAVPISETAAALQTVDLQSDMNVSTIQDIDAALDTLLHQPWHGLNHDFELIHGLHPMAQAALSVVQEGHEQVNTFHVFTDGSAKGGLASWAFVVIAESCVAGHRIFHKIGYSGDMLSDDIGPYNPTSLDAEATAIIAATEYLLARSAPTHIQLNLHLHFDCTAVGWGSVGRQNLVCKQGVSTRQEGARIMVSLLQAKHGITGHHVHAHDGQPWNEMADSVATWIRCGGQCQNVPVLKCGPLLSNPWKKWAWMQVRPTEECPDLQTILSKVDVQPVASSPDTSFAQVTTEAAEGNFSTQSSCTIRLATFNAGTFEYRFEKNDLPTSHKAKEIMHQLDRAHYDFVAVQETRARHDQTWMDGPFLRFISAGIAGQAGVELWVHEYHLSCKLNRTIQSSDFTVWYNDPRLLCVHFDLDKHGVDIVVCYAPQAGRPEDEICAFWNHCQEILEQRAWKAPVWFMGDINGKIGCLESNSVGSFAADMEDVGGQCFHRLCDTFNWIVPATFAKWHQGASNTFVSALGHETRLDFIAVDEFFEEGIQSSYVDDSIDLLNGDMDHKLVVLELTFVPQGTRREGYRRKHWYDRNQAKINCKQECHALTQLQAIAWDKATTEHWDIMRDHFQFTMSKQFPCRKRQKRQLYFSEESWSLVCQRKDTRMEFRSLQRVGKLLLLKRCFQGWRRSDRVDVQQHNLERHNNRMQLALTFEERCKLDEAFRKQKRHDWKVWAEQQIAKRLQESQYARGSEIFHILRPKKAIAKHAGKTRKPLPGLQDKSGVWKRSRHEVALAWQAQFSAIENAEVIGIHDLRTVRSQGSQSNSVQALLEIPDLFDLERALRMLNADKAAGFDGLGAEIFKGDPAQAAMRLFPLLLKMSLRGEWPAEFSGGWSLPLFKHKGSSKHMQGYRAIMLEPTLARAYSRSWRPYLLTGLQKISAVNQWGGRRGLGISALHLQLRMTQQRAQKERKCLALLFLDLQSAFYSVAKPLLAKWSGDVAQLYDLCSTLGIPDAAADVFINHVENSDCVAKATGSDLTAKMVQASLARTWFVIPDSHQLCAPKTGSRPGDPLADVLFAYIMAAILDGIQERMEEAQLIDTHADDQMLPSQMVTWVDDVAISVTGNADDIVARVMQTFTIVNQVITEFGMTLSMGPGKSAVMLNFAGKGAVAARQACEKRFGQHLTVLNEYSGCTQLPLVGHYKHLGGYLVRNGAVMPELRIRAAQATSRLKPLRYITKDKRLAIEQRRMMLKSLALPILTLRSGTWSNLGKQEFQTWSGALFKLYSAMQGRDQDGTYESISFYQAAHNMQSPMPMEMLHLQKLRLAFQIMDHGDEAMFSSVIMNWRAAGIDSWLAGVQRSLTWLIEQTDAQDVHEICGGLQDIAVWRTRKPHVRRLRKLLKQAETAHLLRIRGFCELQHTDQLQKQTFTHMGWQQDVSDSKAEAEEEWKCDDCGQSFPTPASLSVHEQKKHGKRIAIRRFLTDGACRACGRYFHTRARAIQHVHYSQKGCWFFHMRWLVPMTEEQAKVLDETACHAGEAWHHHGLKAHCKDQQWRPCTDSELQPILAERLEKQNVGLEEPSEEEIRTWSGLGILPVDQGGKQRTVRKPKTWQIYNVIEDLVQLEHSILEDGVRWDTDWHWIPPELPYNARFYLILFSGHRRHEDIACWATWTEGVFPVSIDTAIHKQHGNLHDIGFWVHLIVSGLVIGAHGAPPCETFSLARWLELLDAAGQRRGPRPLRDTDYPWGLPYRALREVRQCTVGSILMAKTIQILMLVYYFGGCFTMEHPRGPSDGQQPWGIWKSGYVKRVKMLAQVGLVNFIQGPLGVPFYKPTIIIQGRLPHLAMAIYGAYNSTWRCTEILGGLQDGNQDWKTGKAKAYPSALCCILAQQTAWYARTVSRKGWTNEPDDPRAKEIIEALTQPWDAYSEDCGSGMLNDFQKDAFK